MKKTISIQVYGKVQGVWFRASTKEKATALNIVGTVQNKTDGSVYIEAHGMVDALNLFQAWCKEGPEFAKVDRIEQADLARQDYNGFTIIR